MEKKFEKMNVIVIGAGSGIGQATTMRLLTEGARVFAIDVSTESHINSIVNL